MIASYLVTHFAQAYGQGFYNGCNYNDSVSCSAATTPASGSTLANTGIWVIGFVSLACLLICVAIVVRAKRRSKNSEAPEIVFLQDDEEQDRTKR